MSMGRSIAVAVLAAGMGLLAAHVGALAQQTPQPYAPPLVGAEPPPQAASPDGAVYIPGVGFRYVAPGGPRVYGWAYGYRAPVYGYYRAYADRPRYRHYRRVCDEHRLWTGERCVRARRR
jgi:hypothetical protein